ncbi:hypothetical protein CMUS01_12032 [Colletotrichum musicola]|uniref:Uncharacterized protein n=1 Tax=Colletotrichum musicola TaxID=2175873 RepID=A0A8H6JRA9_9PEZI|nr:hypothetical protein CMUS01_12032 [Colletotrichum musicola]
MAFFSLSRASNVRISNPKPLYGIAAGAWDFYISGSPPDAKTILEGVGVWGLSSSGSPVLSPALDAKFGISRRHHRLARTHRSWLTHEKKRP